MISLYQPGSSLIHRLSAGYKLAAFAVIALALSFAPATWVTVVLCVILPVLGYAVAQIGRAHV